MRITCSGVRPEPPANPTDLEIQRHFERLHDIASPGRASDKGGLKWSMQTVLKVDSDMISYAMLLLS